MNLDQLDNMVYPITTYGYKYEIVEEKEVPEVKITKVPDDMPKLSIYPVTEYDKFYYEIKMYAFPELDSFEEDIIKYPDDFEYIFEKWADLGKDVKKILEVSFPLYEDEEE